MTVALILATIPLGLMTLAVFMLMLLRRTNRRIENLTPGNLIIFAAHPDDCVISAGEIGIRAIEAGCEVRIVYLTTGAGADHPEIADTRRADAVKAWGLLGLTEGSLTFLGFPHAPNVREPSAITESGMREALEKIAVILRNAPRDVSVVVPAEGESHSDHVTLRNLVLSAIEANASDDIKILETPEYNCYYSLFYAPIRALAFIAQCIPVLSRFVPCRSEALRAEVIHGRATWRLPPDPIRLGKKLEMLAQFSTENQDQLIGFFGFPDRLRVRAKTEAASTTSFPRYYALGSAFVTRAIIALIILLAATTGMAFGAAVQLTLGLAQLPGIAAFLATLAIGLLLLAFSLTGRKEAGKRLFLFSLSLGYLAGYCIAL